VALAIEIFIWIKFDGHPIAQQFLIYRNALIHVLIFEKFADLKSFKSDAVLRLHS